MANTKTKTFFAACVTLAATTAAATARAGVVSYTGALTGTDPTFNRPVSTTTLSGVGTAVAYDTDTFVADTAGPYSIAGDYTAGGVGTAAGLDGYLFLYAPAFVPAFVPATPLLNLVAAEDDFDPDGTAGPAVGGDGSLIPSSGAYGPATSATTLTLTPGVPYTPVVSSFYNTTATNGLGAYTVTISGAATGVPEPIALAAGAAGAVGLPGRRRTRRA